ncbi:F-box/FBD/LRR-repeat protein At1g16930-like [Abrus precatorius]|uniref:F-box/FBD/LRR-repeat protein At1g16930-like n=1 Tax=Abrus precatorius TaxID=3816 RepID=A0A8B8LE31_ABRPR|nr:F-box/FBD/LRR-repeat protein At1g16930-like [Abrus precatorius]
MAEPSEKVLKRTQEGDNTDRLSALSDCVLLNILSLLETKEAAATSILSVRWRNLFLSLPDINLRFCVDDDASDRDRLFDEFVRFANRVIGHRNKAPIRKIRLYLKHFLERFSVPFQSVLMSAAAAISTDKVEQLDILVEIDKPTEQFSVPLPPGILSSETLVSLSLSLDMGWNVPDLVWLPNLKYLYLISFRLVDEDSIQRFLRGCPLLENLVLIVQSFSYENESEESIKVEALRVSSPLLKSLVLCWNEKVESEFNVFVKSENLESLVCSLEGHHKVTIDAPNLKSLTINGHVLEVHIIQSLVSIDEAVIQAEFLFNVTSVDDLFFRAQHAFKFYSGLQNVKSLNLSENILKALYFSPPVMPTFRNLIKLKLTPDYCHYFPRSGILQVLSNLFESCPNLDVLIFSEVFDNYFGEDEEFDSVLPVALPLTFIEHLKVVEMNNFKGKELEFKLVEYFLKNGRSLKKIALEREGWKSVPKYCDRILSFKKCSEDCQIVFKKKWDFIKCPRLRQAMNLSP